MMAQTSAAIELVPEQFCVKYNPPILGILYHLTNNKEARFVHNIEINLNEEINPKNITTHLFQAENMYLNKKFVSFNQVGMRIGEQRQVRQVEKLIKKIAMHTNILRKNLMPPSPQAPPQQTDDDAQKSLAKQRLLKRKGLSGMSINQQEGEQGVDNQDDSNKQKKMLQQQNLIENPKFEQKKDQIEQDDDFVDEDFGDFDDLPFENNDEDEQKQKMGKKEEAVQKQKQVQKEQQQNLQADAVVVDNNEEDQDVGDQPSGQSQQFITIHDVQYRKIQIEGDQEQYLMDPQGNIFDLNGTFIGTANSSALEQQEVDANEGNE